MEEKQKKPEKESLLKVAIGLFIGISAGKVIDDVIDSLVPSEAKLPAKILRKIGSWSLGWLIGDWACDKTMEYCDDVEEQVKAIAAKINEINKEEQAEETEE